MSDHLKANRELWNHWTDLHQTAEMYDLAGFRAGKTSLRVTELTELTDVGGKSLLHLQCHFGLDTLSWARKGARVTGVDLSGRAIAVAQSLSADLGIPARFICSDIADLPDVLSDQFDIVFTSYGVLHWIRDLRRWGQVIAHFLAPGGIFYIVEDHPFMRVFSPGEYGLLVADNPYFFSPEAYRFESQGSYASPATEDTPVAHGYMWDHSLGEILDVLIGAGLRIEFLHEFQYASREKFPGMVQDDDGLWRLTAQRDSIPLLFSLQARKENARDAV